MRKYSDIINKYVPNSHIAETFKEYLIVLNLESKYTHEYGNVKQVYRNITDIGNNPPELYDKLEDGTYTKTEIKNRKILEYMGDYFDSTRLKNDGVEEIIGTYKKLNEKRDIVRNLVKLQRIELSQDLCNKENSKYYKLKTNSI